MSLRGVTITEGKVGSNVAGDNRQFGLIGNGKAVEDRVALETLYTLRRPSDAEAIGIDKEYDENNNVNIFRHISEFYRCAGEGKILHIMLVGDDIKPKNMVNTSKKLVVEAGGLISDLAFVFNPSSSYEDVNVDGLNEDVKLAIPELQKFAQWCDDNDMPLHTILEGRAISDNLSQLTNLRDLKTGDTVLSAQKVTVVIGQDWNYAETLTGSCKKFADVGTFLGVVASAAWNRNPGEVATQNLSDVIYGIFTVGGLSNHKKYSDVFEILETLNDKGYVFPIRYQGISGYWWNDGHCCCPIVVDKDGSMNQHTIYYSHTFDECKRALRTRFLDEVKRPVQLPDGKLPASMVDYFDATGDMIFNKLAGRELISEGKTYTDPDSDLLIEKVLKLRFAVIPTGCVNEIIGTMNLKNQAL